MIVSVVIPCFNGEAFVGDAIQSVLAQSHRDVECIVVDDRSTDRSRDVVAQFQALDARVKAIHLATNSGPGAARNAGIDAAGGDWIAILDADDMYEPDRIERLVDAGTRVGADLIADNLKVLEVDTGRVLHPVRYLADGEKLLSLETFLDPPGKQARDMTATVLQPMFRHDFLKRCGIRYHLEHRMAEDLFIYVECLLAGGRFFVVPYEGYVCRVRTGSLSRSGSWTFQATARAYADLLKKHEDRMSVLARQIIRERMKEAEQLADYARVRDSILSGRVLQGLLLLVERPRALWPVAGIAWRKLKRAFGASKFVR